LVDLFKLRKFLYDNSRSIGYPRVINTRDFKSFE